MNSFKLFQKCAYILSEHLLASHCTGLSPKFRVHGKNRWRTAGDVGRSKEDP